MVQPPQVGAEHREEQNAEKYELDDSNDKQDNDDALHDYGPQVSSLLP